ncbi:hypothetical protein ABT168_03405 [Streptomyces sp. NPDC001793]|uniref:hypothetical protein n=1 Tax=Streptomyces sp. NPDC001793 TaxID=3154657 RepID=UPI00332225D4
MTVNLVSLFVGSQTVQFSTSTPPTGMLTIFDGNFSPNDTTSPVQVTLALPPFTRWNGVQPPGHAITALSTPSDCACPQILRYLDQTHLDGGQKTSVNIGLNLCLPTNSALPAQMPNGAVNAVPTGNDLCTDLSRSMGALAAVVPAQPSTPPPGSNPVDLYFVHSTATLLGTQTPTVTEFQLFNNLTGGNLPTTANSKLCLLVGPYYHVTTLPPGGTFIHQHQDFADYDIVQVMVPPAFTNPYVVPVSIQASTYTGPDGNMHSGPDGPRNSTATYTPSGNDFDQNSSSIAHPVSQIALDQLS